VERGGILGPLAAGRDHPDTLDTRHNIARWTGEADDAPKALQLFRELVPDRERVLGRDHPDTLLWIGVWTIRNGNFADGCWHLRERLARAESRLGMEYPVRRRFVDSIQTPGCGESRRRSDQARA
jgi:hypothetical protein